MDINILFESSFILSGLTTFIRCLHRLTLLPNEEFEGKSKGSSHHEILLSINSITVTLIHCIGFTSTILYYQ